MSFGGGNGGRRREKKKLSWALVQNTVCRLPGGRTIIYTSIGKTEMALAGRTRGMALEDGLYLSGLGDLTEWLPTVVNVDFE